MKVYLITDTHFSHTEKMMLYCNRPKDYEDRIIEGISKLKEEDILIHLGDVCIGDDKYNNRLFCEKCKARKILVKGNHDKKSNRWYLEHGWDFVCYKFQDKFFGKTILFSHQPQRYESDLVNTQYGAGNFDINIHGHFHNTLHRLLEGRYLVEGEKERNKEDLMVLTGFHKLLAIEYTNYKPISLEKFLKADLKAKLKI